ncbi:MAG: S-layer homology domain-containing protein, partial [Oscillospiraceae bacterium]
MKGVKKVLSVCLIIALLIGIAPLSLAAGGGYSDVPESHWAYDVIEKWSNSGILQGNGSGAFEPEREMTLGEIAAVLSRLFDYSARTAVQVTPEWADAYVEQAIAAGVIDKADSIDASVVVTREQLVRYIAAAFGIDPVKGSTTFADDARIGAAYKSYVNAFQKLGYVQGKGKNSFDPKAGCTRAEVAQLLENVTRDRGTPEKAQCAMKAGMGAGEITFDQAMFPVEGFNGKVHLNPYARVLVMEQETKVAIVSLELVNVPSDVIMSIKSIVSKATGTPAANVWVHATHAITTPHAPEDPAKRELYTAAVETAVTEAAEQAAATFQPASVGVGTGTCEVNANRDIKIGDSWYYGLNSD